MKRQDLLVTISVVLLIAFIVITLRHLCIVARKTDYSNNMRAIHRWLQCHSDIYGPNHQLPNSKYSWGSNPNAEPPNDQASSWRFGLSIWLGQGSMENNRFHLEQRWDSTVNIKARNPEYCWTKDDGSESSYWTNVMAIIGPDTGFELRTAEKLQDCEDLIIAIEVADSGVHWGQPGDMHIDDFTVEDLHGIDGDGIMVLFLDGSVWLIDDSVPLATLKHFFTATGAREHDRKTDLDQWATEYHGPEPIST